ncbi:hypothetical protein BCR36DRAFT_417047 [Piromyces finnis]|uniref:Uncharacterized protein n=1 Tax=Piromyces finnis TaxID=1754191 RepID=A0A1Y1UKW1_9FUNG|nr:hypothetical protein BCR36DRAFT_417047 [Piromyces finnis]|eukprot:ORX38144.1 hypothetical protein BCR36DRAFT_417047 [Piromyces finnis]
MIKEYLFRKKNIQYNKLVDNKINSNNDSNYLILFNNDEFLNFFVKEYAKFISLPRINHQPSKFQYNNKKINSDLNNANNDIEKDLGFDTESINLINGDKYDKYFKGNNKLFMNLKRSRIPCYEIFINNFVDVNDYTDL